MTILSLIERFKQKTFFQLFTIYTRYLIGSAFVIAAFGMGKVIGSFPVMEESDAPAHSISRLFETLTNSGIYWQFIGWAQITAGFLLMTQRFARLGAVIFLPVIANIFVITVAYNFKGTPFITGLMLLANIYLLLWDASALKYLIINPSKATMPEQLYLRIENQKIWIVTGFLLFITIVILSLLKMNPFLLMVACLGEGILAFILYFLLIKKKEFS